MRILRECADRVRRNLRGEKLRVAWRIAKKRTACMKTGCSLKGETLIRKERRKAATE